MAGVDAEAVDGFQSLSQQKESGRSHGDTPHSRAKSLATDNERPCESLEDVDYGSVATRTTARESYILSESSNRDAIDLDLRRKTAGLEVNRP